MLRMLMRRLRAIFHRDDLERELDDEMRFHLEKEVEQNVARGMSVREARTAALRSFGGVEHFKEEARDARGVRLLEETWHDLRYSLRMIRKAPGFTAVAVLSLALGIGANTALFSVVDSVLLRTLPVKDPEQLVLFEWQSPKTFRTSGTSGYGVGGWAPGMRGSSSFHYRVYETLKAQESPLSDLFTFASIWDANISAEGQAEMSDGQYVSGNYFSVLGVPAVIGRTLTVEDDAATAQPAAMISYGYWQTRFGGDPSALGKQVAINKVPFTIVGVTPPGFTGTLQIETNPIVTVPIAFEPLLAGKGSNLAHDGEPGIWWVHLMGRLKPGATAEQAAASLNGAFQSVALELMPPPKKEGEPAQLEAKDYPELLQRSGSQGMTESRRRYTSTIYLLFGVVALVLLIACANVANMLLARSSARGAEITLRLAIGAGRLRLIRQLMTESLVLSALGGVVGVVFAVWGASTLTALGELGHGGFLPFGVDYGLSWRVLGFTVGVSVLTGVVFGLVPAMRATRLDLTSALKEGARTSSGISRSRLSKALVVAQVAMSLMLLFAAGLFVRTVRNLQHVDLGFNQENLLVFRLRPGAAGYEESRFKEFYDQVLARLEAVPGVRSATFFRVPLIAHNIHSTEVILPGETAQTAAEHETNLQIAKENFFEMMGVPLLAGRGFTERDNEGAPKVVIVSETFAKKFFPDQNPIGQRIGFDEKTTNQIEIIGVVGDTKYSSQREDIEPLLYKTWRQEKESLGSMTIALRTVGDPMALAPAVRDAVREVDSQLPVTDITTQTAQATETISEERVFADLLSFFGVLAVLLAAIGLYGVMAYSVAQRTNEIGIRMALGAQAIGVLRLIVWQGLKFALVGLAVGAVAALALKRLVESELYGVGAADPLTFAVVGAMLVAVALVACLIPARRATKVDPVVALRNE